MILLLGLFHVVVALAVGTAFAWYGPAMAQGRGIGALFVSICAVPLTSFLLVAFFLQASGLTFPEAADSAAFVTLSAVLTFVVWGPVAVLVAARGRAESDHG